MDERPRPVSLERVRRIHVIAVGGVGMTALAGLLQRRGFVVTGSDEKLYPPMSRVIERLGIPVRAGYRAENLEPPPDLVVVGNKVSRDNPEVQALLASGLPYLSFPETLGAFFLAGRRSLVVAGTHGKTTSTAMLAWVLECAGRDPSLMVGGESLDFGGNFKLGAGADFVVEGDEYDSAFFDKGPKFLHYRPDAVLLTAVEFDHADIYRDLAAVEEAFRALVRLLGPNAPLVVAADFPRALEVARAAARTITFGESASAAWRIAGLEDSGAETRFGVERGGTGEGILRIRAPGLINARNALGVYALAREIGLTHGEIENGLATFRGVARRQEVVGDYGGVVLIDDFAHHPTAVAGTLAAVKLRYPGRRLWALFEPRSNTSRRRVFQAAYVDALAAADRVVIGEVFAKASDAIPAAELFSTEQLADDLRRRGIAAWSLPSAEAIARLIDAHAAGGDVVVLMSNGDFQGLRALLEAKLSPRCADRSG
jgi:UDP-N-acetylmuramate: L-alanyl-gamma-D-glutamyl-meso-diaminopimelate ligase